MPEKEPSSDPLVARDQGLKERLVNRDESVLVDIDEAYRRPISALLEQQLQRSDADAVFNEALDNLWSDYRPDGGASVRSFLSQVARRRMIDLIRQRSRQRNQLAIILENSATDDMFESKLPEHRVLSREEQDLVTEKLRLVENACKELTPLQRRAFQRRFLAKTDKEWAKELESETEIPAKSWRKYSDSALKRVRKIIQVEGECHDVA